MKVLSIANHKGGTGKTATTRALGDVLAAAGVRVLLVDVDPQSSLTLSCGLAGDVEPNLTDVIGGAQPGKLPITKIIRHISNNLDLAPANLSLAAAELGINQRFGREQILTKALAGLKGYDLVLIDCAPSLGLLVVNALVASNAVLIPTQPMPVDVAGVKMFLDTVDVIRDNLNPGLSIMGILPTFYDARLNAHQGAIEAMERARWAVLPVKVGRSVRVGESAALGESIITFEPDNPQAGAYQELGRLVKLWLEKAK